MDTQLRANRELGLKESKNQRSRADNIQHLQILDAHLVLHYRRDHVQPPGHAFLAYKYRNRGLAFSSAAAVAIRHTAAAVLPAGLVDSIVLFRATLPRNHSGGAGQECERLAANRGAGAQGVAASPPIGAWGSHAAGVCRSAKRAARAYRGA